MLHRYLEHSQKNKSNIRVAIWMGDIRDDDIEMVAETESCNETDCEQGCQVLGILLRTIVLFMADVTVQSHSGHPTRGFIPRQVERSSHLLATEKNDKFKSGK